MKQLPPDLTAMLTQMLNYAVNGETSDDALLEFGLDRGVLNLLLSKMNSDGSLSLDDDDVNNIHKLISYFRSDIDQYPPSGEFHTLTGYNISDLDELSSVFD